MTPLNRDEYQRYALVLALFAGGLYAALIVASFGMLSLFLDRDVITDPQAGPLAGPIMVAAAVAALVLVMLQTAVGAGRGGRARTAEPMHTVPILSVVLAAASAYLVYGVSGGIVVSIGGGDPLRAPLFAFTQLATPFAVAVAVWAAVVGLLYFVLLIWRANGGQRPRWPWEKRPQ